ncbi:uncharacterized protein LOC141649245 [Silene latifolia]|uniref:uncharacterized protein LOC141649245 n=1 Tax=Silene latifolia TaxID=37657 RepID=UPI003D779DA7
MVDILVLEYNAQFMHFLVTDKSTQQQFHHSLVYAFNGDKEREELWSSLRRVAMQVSGPWSTGGDFNCVSQTHERLGGHVTKSEAEPFQHCIEDCNLSDMPSTGAFYTWNNKQAPETRVYSRLDRIFLNHEWSVQLPEYFANFLPEGLFDHTPCLVTAADTQSHKRAFKYYNMWSKTPDFKECVTACWNQIIRGTHMYGVVRKLKLLKPKLK